MNSPEYYSILFCNELKLSYNLVQLIDVNLKNLSLAARNLNKVGKWFQEDILIDSC